MSINWYPGHMAKTRRLMEADLKNIDAVCEIVDARAARSSRNPMLRSLAPHKPRMIVLNRADQADPEVSRKWLEHFRSRGIPAILADSQKGGFAQQFEKAVAECCAPVIEKNLKRGQTGKHLRVMIVGIPNVGKSSFINRLCGRKAAKAADKPGVTRHNEWFSIAGFDFMDTPGMLWPKIESDEMGYTLAFTGTIPDQILDREDLAVRLLMRLADAAPGACARKYLGRDEDPAPEYEADAPYYYDLLGKYAAARSLLVSGGMPDTERMSNVLLDDFRSGKLGRISLERP